MVDVAKIQAKWQKVKYEDSSVDTERGQRSEGRVKRSGSSELQGRDVKGSGKGRAKKPTAAKKKG
jgi:hypothetical protein